MNCCLERFTATFLFCGSAVRNGLVLPYFFHRLPGSRTYLGLQNLGGQLQGSSSHHTLLMFNAVMLLTLLQRKALLDMTAMTMAAADVVPPLGIPSSIIVVSVGVG